jgi:predicted AlkP superfamily pyrophosphatase or phosphodiesterase
MPFAIVLALLLLAGCGGGSSPSQPTAAVPAPTPAPSPKAVVISVDGLRGDALGKTEVPNLKALASRGSYTYQAQTINPSNTLPSHTSMLSGYTPALHKITWDDYLPARGKITVPTIFSAARTAGLRSVMVVGKEKFQHFKDTGMVDVFIHATRGDADIANQAILQAEVGFDVMFVHFPDVDLTGHALSWMSADYLTRVRYVDDAIGRLVAALPEHTTVIVTADHGGHDKDHGTTQAADMTIPWIALGPGIRAGFAITQKVTTIDTAATVARVLKISMSPDSEGKAVTECFQ